MAKAKAEGVSKSQIFRRYFEKKPELLRESSFDDVIAMYKQEFPGRDFTESDRQIAANIKSRLRKELKISRRRRRRRRAAAGAETAIVGLRPHRGMSSMHILEEQIDECLIAARRLDRAELGDVIKHLRRARNLVILHLGAS